MANRWVAGACKPTLAMAREWDSARQELVRVVDGACTLLPKPMEVWGRDEEGLLLGGEGWVLRERDCYGDLLLPSFMI